MMLKKKKKGISIIEIITSLAIIAIIIIPMSNVIIHAVKINKGGEDKQQAAYIGQQILEGLNVNNIEDATSSFLSQTISVNGVSKVFNISATGNGTANIDDYNVTLNVSKDNSINLSDSTNTYDSTITVDWQDSAKTVTVNKSPDGDFTPDVTNLYIVLNSDSLEVKTKNADGSITNRYNTLITSTFNTIGVKFKNYTSATPYNIYVTNNRSNQVNVYLEKTKDKPNWAVINPNGGVIGTYDVITTNNTVKNYNVEIKVSKSGQELYDLKSNIRK
ncbi:hypothetical protein CFOLD11_32530 [Clostridium folliculivorans]|uniref:Prepilin-type N-terminal cleavage/methylation domain-containing protein n=1 Tax=Clostridium folliculivorans TaxID=2886038 RepID=A0A9W5Y4C7_9CLOT|nr:hypothetical protein [Clostridium folliculivorans]GKU26426.1 hypothetical protein CFOLD11_32530 [Clostridium folliculivorans]